MYHRVELFADPLKILDRQDRKHAEMSDFDHAFLCGLIKEKRPKKILEIGVAWGGTTTVIMHCCDMLGIEVSFASVDLNKACYREPDKKTGYVFDSLVDRLDKPENHRFYLGGIYPDFAEEIGNDIDLLVLDTVHSMP
nr:hypothetical protein [Lachnospiraceae bacterium]